MGSSRHALLLHFLLAFPNQEAGGEGAAAEVSGTRKCPPANMLPEANVLVSLTDRLALGGAESVQLKELIHLNQRLGLSSFTLLNLTLTLVLGRGIRLKRVAHSVATSDLQLQ